MVRGVILAAVVVMLLVSACAPGGLGGIVRGSGRINTQPREVSGFDRIELSGSGEVILTQGDQESLAIEADDNIMQFIRAEVQGDTLVLGFNDQARGRAILPSRPIRFAVTADQIRGLKVSGSGLIRTTTLNAEGLSLEDSGSGEIRIDSLQAQELDATLSGSGAVALAGRVEEQRLNISGSGSYEGSNLESRTGRVEVSGSGGATVWVRETLDARVSGSGSISYYGQPQVQENRSGSGSIRSLGNR